MKGGVYVTDTLYLKKMQGLLVTQECLNQNIIYLKYIFSGTFFFFLLIFSLQFLKITEHCIFSDMIKKSNCLFHETFAIIQKFIKDLHKFAAPPPPPPFFSLLFSLLSPRDSIPIVHKMF